VGVYYPQLGDHVSDVQELEELLLAGGHQAKRRMVPGAGEGSRRVDDRDLPDPREILEQGWE